MMKTFLTALVAIPPREMWEPIQAIRMRYDRHVREWMPHVTLLYPFRPQAEFEAACDALGGLGVAPFETHLATIKTFQHYEWSHTLWLDPEPAEPWRALHKQLLLRFPDCDDTSKYEEGFTPHLSVGQSRAADLAQELQRSWRATSWQVHEVALIAREEKRPFEVVRTIALA